MASNYDSIFPFLLNDRLGLGHAVVGFGDVSYISDLNPTI